MNHRKLKTELYHDNFQNYKKYNIPKAQLVITDIPTISVLMLMLQIHLGTTAVTTATVKASLLQNHSLIVTVNLKLQNIFTSATGF